MYRHLPLADKAGYSGARRCSKCVGGGWAAKDCQMNSSDAMIVIALAGIVMSLLSLRSDYLAWRSYTALQMSNRLSLQKAYFERAKSGRVVTAPSTNSELTSSSVERRATGSGAESFTLHKERIRSAQPSRIVDSCSLRACAASTHSPMDIVLYVAAARRNDHFGNSNVS
jgi:hypothetical protein